MRVKTQLKNIASFSKGEQIKGDDLLEDGLYDYLNGGIFPSGKWNSYNTLANTVTISEGGNSCGYVNFMKRPFWCGAHCYYLFNTLSNAKYLYYVLKSQQDRLMKIRSGACMPNIKKSDLGSFEIIYETDEVEQEKIVEILSKCENIICSRKQQLQQLDELVKARFVELFGLPVSNSMNWETEKMQSIAPSQNYLGEMPTKVWLLNLDMVESQTGRIIEYLIVPKDEVGNSTCVFDDSTVLYSKLRPYLNKVVIPDRCGYATSELSPLKPNTSKINREYLAYMLRSDEFVSMISEKVAGAKMPRVSMGDFRNFDVPVPPKELQNEFANFVKQTDKSKFVVQKALDEAQILFDSLMQEYFG